MAEFDIRSSTGPFADIIARHNDAIGDVVRDWRGMVRTHAEALTNFFLDDYPQDRRWVQYWRSRRDNLIQCFQGPGCQGGAHIFDPWNGWWGGVWRNANGSRSKTKHVWDETVSKDDSYIQPVTQSVSGFVHRGNIAQAKRSNTVDLAINVWTPNHGITGWASKRQGQVQEMPHIAYSPNPHTLLWIAQPRPGERNVYWMLF